MKLHYLLIPLAFFAQALACDFPKDPPERLESRDSPGDFHELDWAEREIDLEDVDHVLLREAIFHETNLRRSQEGEDLLEHLPELDEAACMHARDMVEGDFFAHDNPHDPERETPVDRVTTVGLEARFVAENIAQEFGLQYESGERVYVREEDGETVFSREPGGPAIARHTYSSFAQALLDGWMDSPGHRENILSDEARYLGNACTYKDDDEMPLFYCVQLFFDRF